MASESARHTHASTFEVMDTVASIHMVLDDGAAVPQKNLDAFEVSLHADEALFSPFLADSAITLLRQKKLALADAPSLIREVETKCRSALAETNGLFNAWWQGWFDPTGYVKGWAVERAFAEHLLPLVRGSFNGIVGIYVGVGGDIRAATYPDSGWTWHAGIIDPEASEKIVATVDIKDGGIATSGISERGQHIIDPRSGKPARGVAQATVIADSLERADLWATTAVVAGFDDLSWVTHAGTKTGFLISDDGHVKRWAGPAELIEPTNFISRPPSAAPK